MTIGQLEIMFVLERFANNDVVFDTFVDHFWSNFEHKGGVNI